MAHLEQQPVYGCPKDKGRQKVLCAIAATALVIWQIVLGQRPNAESVRVVQNWFKHFRFGNFDVKDEPRSRRPFTDKVDAVLEKRSFRGIKLHALVDRRAEQRLGSSQVLTSDSGDLYVCRFNYTKRTYVCPARLTVTAQVAGGIRVTCGG
ncbi:hypothetical protein EVAR_4878_1 [Eumeta japonica]|uniref:Uncharacterized protein n=1 Tax=Eumeta variegata TaxID=151549 RepID=A0A4C1SZB9_EUMVA|nr:hypothetical protein EVAR_4878_1 [Eumeta japonica]